MSKYYKVGKIVNTHGVRGEVRVLTSSDFAETRYRSGNRLYFFKEDDHNAEAIPLTILSHRTHKHFDLLSFENHSTLNDVKGYKGGFLMMNEKDREELDEGEYYYDQIIGCEVITDTGESLGKIIEILSPGANDVWVIQPYESGKDILIPYIDQVVKEIHVDEQKVMIHVMEGLLS